MLVAAGACALVAAPADAARTEQQLVTPPGPFAAVAKSLVTIDAPLPASVTGAPDACQQLQYYRYRRAAGPTDPQQSDAVFVNMPGVLAGSGSLEMNALEVVQDAADSGGSVEVWALNRRSNCLEDHTGLQAAAAAKDAGVALDYYLHGVPVNGKTFAGFKRNRDIPYVGEFDLKQTVEDYRAVIVDGIPDPAVRQEKVFCGGHSLGGFLTGALMAWDFDGDPATTADAGYKLCHASIALDTVVTAGGQALEDNPTLSPALKSASSFAYTSVTNWVRSNLRSVDFGVIGPETMTTLEGVGLNAQIAPDADIAALMGKLPRGGASETALRLFHSRTLLDAVAPDTKLRVQHLSGEALLGAMMDDNSQPLAFIQTSFGTFDHGPVAPKQFPLSGRALMFPTDDTTPYGWANYNETLPNLLRPSGVPYSSPESEVSDVQDVARVLHEGLGFIEAYFPTRITTDVGFAQAGSRDGDLRHIRYVDAPRTLPRITIQGKEGIGVMPPQPAIGGVANEHIVLPGYNHLDLIMAAPVQRGGVPEPTAAAVARFMLEQSGRGPTPTVALRSGKASAQTVARRLRAAR